MDKRLAGLYITVVETSRSKHFAISDGEIEVLSEITSGDLNSIQNALNKCLASYKEKVNNLELGLDIGANE